MKSYSPKEYEQEVLSWFSKLDKQIDSFKVHHREKLEGSDGEYEIDIVIKYTFLGASFIVLIECKKYKNSVKRETVQILNDKLKSIGAHKGILISTSNFQTGAINYASNHGIALIKYISGENFWLTRKKPTKNFSNNKRLLKGNDWFIITNEITIDNQIVKIEGDIPLGLKSFLFNKKSVDDR